MESTCNVDFRKIRLILFENKKSTIKTKNEIIISEKKLVSIMVFLSLSFFSSSKNLVTASAVLIDNADEINPAVEIIKVNCPNVVIPSTA